MIGWGAGPCCEIQREDGFLWIIGWSKCAMIEFLMINCYVETQRESQFMIMLIGLGGVQQA